MNEMSPKKTLLGSNPKGMGNRMQKDYRKCRGGNRMHIGSGMGAFCGGCKRNGNVVSILEISSHVNDVG